jgi:hypothetical protein
MSFGDSELEKFGNHCTRTLQQRSVEAISDVNVGHENGA